MNPPTQPTNFPPDFRKKEVEEILKTVKRGQCLQLVGLPGSGKSMLLFHLSTSPEILKFHLSENAKNYSFIYLDLNLLSEKSTNGALSFILSKLEEKPLETKDPIALVKKVETLIQEKSLPADKKVVLIFDAFDNLSDASLSPLFQILKGIHNQNRFNLSFIFATTREIACPKALSPFGKLGGLVCEKIYYLPPLSQKDALWYLKTAEKQAGEKLPPLMERSVLALSGGSTRTIKRLIQALSTSQKLEDLKENPTLDIHLNYYFEELLESLDSEKEALVNLIRGDTEPQDKEPILRLKNLYVLDPGNKFTNPLFLSFLKQKFGQGSRFSESINDLFKLQSRLTANECKALNFLTKNKNRIIPREELISAVWGENASLEIANHAVDQLLHRLKEKLQKSDPPVAIETVRGRGHRLIVRS